MIVIPFCRKHQILPDRKSSKDIVGLWNISDSKNRHLIRTNPNQVSSIKQDRASFDSHQPCNGLDESRFTCPIGTNHSNNRPSDQTNVDLV